MLQSQCNRARTRSHHIISIQKSKKKSVLTTFNRIVQKYMFERTMMIQHKVFIIIIIWMMGTFFSQWFNETFKTNLNESNTSTLLNNCRLNGPIRKLSIYHRSERFYWTKHNDRRCIQGCRKEKEVQIRIIHNILVIKMLWSSFF